MGGKQRDDSLFTMLRVLSGRCFIAYQKLPSLSSSVLGTGTPRHDESNSKLTCSASPQPLLGTWERTMSTLSVQQASTSSPEASGDSTQSSTASYTPWTPTRLLVKKSNYKKRMGFLMQCLDEESVRAVQKQETIPEFSAGDILEVRVIVPENQRKEYIYKGVCIGRYNKGIRSSFKIYNVFPDVGGFVQHLPLHMPDLVSIKVVGRIPARRSKLYYMLNYETSQYMFQNNIRVANDHPANATKSKGK